MNSIFWLHRRHLLRRALLPFLFMTFLFPARAQQGNGHGNGNGNSGNGNSGSGNGNSGMIIPGNAAPSLNGLPSGNIVQVRCGGTTTITISASDPDLGQWATLQVDDEGTCGVSKIVRQATAPGGVSDVTLTITGDSCNRGMHVIYLTATDNGAPAASTRAVLKYVITGPPAPAITGPAFTCPGGLVTLTASGGSNYRWSNGATGAAVRVGPGVHTVTTSQAGCFSPAARFEVIAKDEKAPLPAQAQLPVMRGECSVTVQPPVATDNCAGLVTGSTSDPLTYTTQGAFTITWTFSDGNGNSTTQTQQVVVQDQTPPQLLTAAGALDRTLSCSDAAGITAAAALQPEGADNCGTALLQLLSDNTIATCGGAYERIRSWRFTDAVGNQSAVYTQIIRVVDRSAPVITFHTASVQLCHDSTSDRYAVPVLSAIDSCSSVSYKWEVRDAAGNLLRTGEGSNASGSFAVGYNTIRWTLSDACGNTTIATTTVFRNPAITAAFQGFQVQGGQPRTLYLSAFMPASSARMGVLATGGTAPYRYAWSIESGVAATLQLTGDAAAVQLVAAAAGSVVLRCVVTDARGCAAVFRNTIWVVDARCGNKGDKVQVCQRTSSASNPWVPICIAPAAVATHLANGSLLGACRTGSTARSIYPAAMPQEEEVHAPLLAYPNPARDRLTLHLPDVSGMVTLELCSLQGSVVLRRNVTAANGSLELDLRATAAGSFLLRIWDGRQVRTVRVLRVR